MKAFLAGQKKRNEYALANLVLPVLKTAQKLLFCTDYFAYDEQGSIAIIRGSRLRKVAVYILQALQMIQIVAQERLGELKRKSDSMRTLHRGVTLAYLLNISFTFCSLNMKTARTEELLQQIQKIECDLSRTDGESWFGSRKAKVLSLALVVACVALAIIFWLQMRLDIGVLITQGFTPWLEMLAENAMDETQQVFGYNLNYDPAKAGASSNAIFPLPFLAFNLFYDLHWSLGLLLNLMWGIVFVQTFKMFYEKMDEAVCGAECNVQDICQFNEITFALDSFNDAFGGVILGAMISGGSHAALYILTVFNATSGPVDALMTALVFILYSVQLFACAEVSRQAEKMKKVLKKRFNASAKLQRSSESLCSEPRTHGIVMLFAELSTSCIGFEGFGFFTLTYSLIGSVLSIILTYAVVALQLG